jgi:hypothetical protein
VVSTVDANKWPVTFFATWPDKRDVPDPDRNVPLSRFGLHLAIKLTLITNVFRDVI